MIEKIINRNIGKSQKCRIKYGSSSDFNVLIMNVNDGKRTRIYSIDAQHLSSQKNSIYFYPEIRNGVVTIKWYREIENYVNEVQ